MTITPRTTEHSTPPVNSTPTDTAIPKLPLWGSVILFAIPTICMWLATRMGIPWLQNRIAGPDILCWFIAGGAVFFGLFLAAFVGFWFENRSVTLGSFANRLRFRRLSWNDVIYTIVALAVCSLASGVIFFIWAGIATSTTLIAQPELTPPFVHMEPLTPDIMWLLAAWLPLFFFNITGEELWWRGYIQPIYTCALVGNVFRGKML